MSGGSTKYERRQDSARFQRCKRRCKDIAFLDGLYVWLDQMQLTAKPYPNRTLCRAFVVSRTEDDPILLLVTSQGEEIRLAIKNLGAISLADDSEVVYETLKGVTFTIPKTWVSQTLRQVLGYWQWREKQGNLEMELAL